MAEIYGKPEKEFGDNEVYRALKALPSDWLVYAQVKLSLDSDERHPDYILVHRTRGVIVLEVKDWIEIKDRDAGNALILRKHKREPIWQISPVTQARNAAMLLSNILKKHRELQVYSGKLAFPYRHAGALPNISNKKTIEWLEEVWTKGRVLGSTDLYKTNIQKSLLAIPTLGDTIMMTDKQFDEVRTIMDKRLIVGHRKGQRNGIHDVPQEKLSKEGLHTKQKAKKPKKQKKLFTFPRKKDRIKHLENELPDEVKDLKTSTYVRLVRGYAGTGKTDVLILKADYLHGLYPEKKFLVTTFNVPVYENRLKPELQDLHPQVVVEKFDTLCSAIFKKRHQGKWVSPQNTRGLVTSILSNRKTDDEFDTEFIAEEFTWMKEIGRTSREEYVNNVREGRGGEGGQTLRKRQKHIVFDLFETYEKELDELGTHDWVDMHTKVLRYLEEGIEPDEKYDVVFIDEAQHFAPTWMKIIQHFIKPGGELFICDDPSQSVYRAFSWKQKNINVIGRTKWLRIPYRTTREIFNIAYLLTKNNPQIQQLAKEETKGNRDPIFDNSRSGDIPSVHQYSTKAQEVEHIKKEISDLIQSGLLPNEIAILHTKDYIIKRYKDSVPSGVQIDDISRRTGTEYKAVFIPQIQDLFQSSSINNIAKKQMLFYTAITRARDNVFIGIDQKSKWPKELEIIKEEFVWHNHREKT